MVAKPGTTTHTEETTMIYLLIDLINATPDALRFALMDAGADDLMRWIADAADLTYFEDGSIG